jgi:hemolysin activation/secretion protein
MKCCIIIILLFCTANAFSATLDQIDIEHTKVIQNQDQIEKQERNTKEFNEIGDKRFLDEVEDDDFEQDSIWLRCYFIQKIKFTKNNIFSKEDERFIAKHYEKKCLPIALIIRLKDEITEKIKDKGYEFSYAIVPHQDLTKKEILFEIVEAKLKDIQLNNETLFDKTEKMMAFGLLPFVDYKGSAMNMKNLNQGLNQLNNIPSNKATIDIVQDDEKNFIAKISKKVGKTYRIKASVDNNGSKKTGEKRDTIGFSKDNLFHLNDIFSISRTASDLKSDNEGGRLEIVNGSLSVPFLWNNFAINHTERTFFFLVNDIKSSGKISSDVFSFDRKLVRSEDLKIVSNVSLTTRKNRTYLDGNLLDSKNFTIASTSVSNTFFFKDSKLLVRPSFLKSIQVLNASKDAADIDKSSPHTEFEIGKLYANFTHKTILPYSHISANYNITFDSQVSNKKLYSSDRFSIGGLYSVRGFKSGIISGDSGYNLRNEITFNLKKSFSVAPFYDYGFIRSKADLSKGRLSGTGVKASFSKKKFTANLVYAIALSKSQLLKESENSALYFDASFEF